MAEAKKKVVKKDDASVEPTNLEVPVTAEKDETTAAVEAAEQEQQVIEEKRDMPVAKAGKRSNKSLQEAAEKQAKEERKTHADEAEAKSKPKQPVKPARTRLERRSNNFRDKAKLVEKGKLYTLKDAAELATKTSPVKFDATVELHVNLAVDPRQADQNIRGNLMLPAGTGKKVRVAVFDDSEVEGADLMGIEAITKSLEKGEINFDILVATPAQMPKLGKFARTLGPRGLMPNPKSGTVTTDLNKAVAEAKAGRVEYRVDSTGIVHLGVGKASFTPKQLQDNLEAVVSSLRSNKPQSVKGIYVKAAYVTTTMGPSIKLNPSEL